MYKHMFVLFTSTQKKSNHAFIQSAVVHLMSAVCTKPNSGLRCTCASVQLTSQRSKCPTDALLVSKLSSININKPTQVEYQIAESSTSATVIIDEHICAKNLVSAVGVALAPFTVISHAYLTMPCASFMLARLTIRVCMLLERHCDLYTCGKEKSFFVNGTISTSGSRILSST